MHKRSLTLDEKIEKAQQKVIKTKTMYDSAVEELKLLQDERMEKQKNEKEEQNKRMIKDFEQSTDNNDCGTPAIKFRHSVFVHFRSDKLIQFTHLFNFLS